MSRVPDPITEALNEDWLVTAKTANITTAAQEIIAPDRAAETRLMTSPKAITYRST